MPTFASLEIAIEREDADRYTVQMRFTPPGSDTIIQLLKEKPILTFDFKALNRQRHNAEDYGQTLTRTLFGEKNQKNSIGRAFSEACAVVKQAKATLRVRLFIGYNASKLHSLRWETLRDPQSDSPLLTNKWITFSRYLSGEFLISIPPPPKSNLKALVVIANPANLDPDQLAPVNVSGELARAKTGLGDDIQFTVLARLDDSDEVEGIEVSGLATLQQIQDHLQRGYDILYLVAHGIFEENTPRLWLENDVGNADVISGEDLVTRLGELRQHPRLAVLASCQSAGTGDQRRSSDEGALATLGPRLAQIGVPAVLAMQGNIRMRTLETFMPRFFTELQEDGRIDRAMAEARGIIRTETDWWVPVLFSRLQNNNLFADQKDIVLEDLQDVLPEKIEAYLQGLKEQAGDIVDAKRGQPYRGLSAYDLTQAELFFGRRSAIEQVLRNLQDGHNTLTLVYAKPPLGKSSLLQAGVLPCLLGLEDLFEPLFGHREPLDFLDLSAYNLPLYLKSYPKATSLAQSIQQAIINKLNLGELSLEQDFLIDLLYNISQTLNAQESPGWIYLLLDDFEAHFDKSHEKDKQAFEETLLQCLSNDQIKVRWLFTSRQEGLNNFFARQVFKDRKMYTLTPLTEDAARAVIEKTAVYFDLELEAGLVERLLSDLRDDDGFSPQKLQLVWEGLYKKFVAEPSRDSDQLKIALYEAGGNVQGFLQGYLNVELEELFSKQRGELAKDLLALLIGPDNQPDSRTKADILRELFPYDLETDRLEEVEHILARLQDKAFIRLVDEESSEPAFTLAHDFLVEAVQRDPKRQMREAQRRLLDLYAYTLKHEKLGDYQLALLEDEVDWLNLNKYKLDLLFRSALASGCSTQTWSEQTRKRGLTTDLINYWLQQVQDLSQMSHSGEDLEAAALELARLFACLPEIEVIRRLEMVLGDNFSWDKSLNIQAKVILQALALMPSQSQAAKTLRQFSPAEAFVLVPPQMDEKDPAAQKQTPAFWIARSPVSEADWQDFIQASPDLPPYLRTNILEPKTQAAVKHITWYQANRYVAWRRKTWPLLALPSKAEWQQAVEQGCIEPVRNLLEWTESIPDQIQNGTIENRVVIGGQEGTHLLDYALDSNLTHQNLGFRLCLRLVPQKLPGLE